MRQLTDAVSRSVAAKLAELQGDRTDAEMARLLGVSRPHWSHIRAGRRQISYASVKRASEVWPVISRIVVHDLTAPTEMAS